MSSSPFADRLAGLDPRLVALTDQLIEHCALRGVEIRPNEGLRTPYTQARYWRQSRTRAEVDAQISRLRSRGAPFLAYCLEVVGPQVGTAGKHVTHALPGFSWHQHGEALDFFWIVGGKAEWSVKRVVSGANGWIVLAQEAKALRLTPGGLWLAWQDWPHVQLRNKEPHEVYSLEQIDAVMRERFEGVEP